MSRISYVNGHYLPHSQAMTSIEDRGYQFGDGVYEYFAFYNGNILDLDLHLARLARSLNTLGIASPMGGASLSIVMRELIEKNGRADGGLYLQVTRGVARRDHPFPKEARPVLSMTICAAKLPKPEEKEKGARAVTLPDIRWGRCDVKSIALLANVLAKQQAAASGVREAWLYRPDGTVTEGSVSNVFIVTERGEIVTHPADEHILGGVTRDVALKLARENGIKVSERPFTLAEARAAGEAFLTSTSANVLPVTELDKKPVGSGRPGPITLRLAALYNEHVFHRTGKRL